MNNNAPFYFIGYKAENRALQLFFKLILITPTTSAVLFLGNSFSLNMSDKISSRLPSLSPSPSTSVSDKRFVFFLETFFITLFFMCESFFEFSVHYILMLIRVFRFYQETFYSEHEKFVLSSSAYSSLIYVLVYGI